MSVGARSHSARVEEILRVLRANYCCGEGALSGRLHLLSGIRELHGESLIGVRIEI